MSLQKIAVGFFSINLLNLLLFCKPISQPVTLNESNVEGFTKHTAPIQIKTDPTFDPDTIMMMRNTVIKSIGFGTNQTPQSQKQNLIQNKKICDLPEKTILKIQSPLQFISKKHVIVKVGQFPDNNPCDISIGFIPVEDIIAAANSVQLKTKDNTFSLLVANTETKLKSSPTSGTALCTLPVGTILFSTLPMLSDATGHTKINPKNVLIALPNSSTTCSLGGNTFIYSKHFYQDLAIEVDTHYGSKLSAHIQLPRNHSNGDDGKCYTWAGLAIENVLKGLFNLPSPFLGDAPTKVLNTGYLALNFAAKWISAKDGLIGQYEKDLRFKRMTDPSLPKAQAVQFAESAPEGSVIVWDECGRPGAGHIAIATGAGRACSSMCNEKIKDTCSHANIIGVFYPIKWRKP